MNIDLSQRRNLELVETMRERRKVGSLLWVLDKTVTAMGGRCLRSWIDKPLLNCAHIKRRQRGVDELVKNPVVRGEIRQLLAHVQDLERLVSKIVTGAALGRDLIALSNSLSQLPKVKDALLSLNGGILYELGKKMDTLQEIVEIISRAIVAQPPFSIREGGIIREGFDENVDKYRRAMYEGTDWLTSLEAKEREQTGIKNLKVGYNRVFGYYIEVSKSNINSVPERYVRKQTLANSDRYITGELKEIENMLVGAKSAVTSWNTIYSCKLRDEIAKKNEQILKTAQMVAQIDVLSSLAEVAAQNGYHA